MAKILHTQIEINTSTQEVWKILMKTNEYPQWNPFVSSIKGELKVGEDIEVELPGMKFKPKVVSLIENQEFKWLGHLFVKGLFDGKHQFILQKITETKTLFIHKEEFKGALVPLFKKMIEGKTKDGFMAMNLALKKECEKV